MYVSHAQQVMAHSVDFNPRGSTNSWALRKYGEVIVVQDRDEFMPHEILNSSCFFEERDTFAHCFIYYKAQ